MLIFRNAEGVHGQREVGNPLSRKQDQLNLTSLEPTLKDWWVNTSDKGCMDLVSVINILGYVS